MVLSVSSPAEREMRLVYLVLVTIAVVGIVSFVAGWQIGVSKGRSLAVDAQNSRYYITFSDSPTRQETLEMLEYARDNHQFYVDHPELTNNFTGSQADNVRWVRLYESIIPDYK